MKIRKRFITILILPFLFMLGSLLLTNEDPNSRRQMLSVVLVYIAFVLLIILSPFAGYYSPAPRVAAGAGFLYFFPFSVLGYFRLEGEFMRAAEAVSYDDEAVMQIVLPIVGLFLAIGFFAAGAIIGFRKQDK